jgi:hypothetical protein
VIVVVVIDPCPPGAMMYVSKLPVNNWQGIGWVLLNSAIAVADRLLQRLLLSKEQCPVDISKILGIV